MDKRILRGGLAAFAGLCVLLAASGVSSQSITINTGTTYQTIDGFGGFSCIKAAKVKQGPFYVDVPLPQHYDTLMYDLGVSLVRFEVSPGYQTAESGPYDVNADVFCGPTVMGNIQQMREFIARGCTRFLFTVWSPPGYMKPVGTANCPSDPPGCYLDPNYYDDFGNFLVDYLSAMEDSTGVTPLALSLQNEPRYSQPFNSCQYNPTQYMNVHRTVVPIVEATFPSIQFIGTEDNSSSGYHLDQWNSFMVPFLGDATLNGYMDILALHYGSEAGYDHIYNNLAQPNGKKIWGSEETHDNSYMGQAGRLHYALETGNASGWIIWTLASLFTDAGDENSRAPQDIYFGCKHYYRFVRPGAVRVGVSGQGGLDVTAFTNDGDGTATVVIINSGGATSATVNGSGLPGTLHVYQTSGSTDRCAYKGTSAPGTSVSLPASSVTTLYSENVTSMARPRDARVPTVGRQVQPRQPRVFSLDGRSLGTSRMIGSGVRLTVEGSAVTKEAAVDMR